MKILIVGSRGFIGSHCLQHFSNLYEVWGCDVVDDPSQSARYFHLKGPKDFSDVFKVVSFDLCINCSGAASVPQSLTDPEGDFYKNTVNVFELLSVIRRLQPQCRFLNLSSAAVYGNPARLPIMETETVNPVSPYGFHKRLSEEICAEFHRFFGIGTASVRIFSAYGPGLRKQLFWDLYQKIKTSGDEIQLFGDGNESRDFIYIEDLVRVLELISEGGSFNGDIINVANGVQVFIKDAVDQFARAIGWNGRIRFTGTPRPGDTLRWQADIQRIKALGYHQSVSFELGINRYVQWVRESELV